MWPDVQVASEAVDKIRTLAALTKEFYFLEKYMSYFDLMKKYVLALLHTPI